MSANEEPQSVEPQPHAAQGVVTALTSEALHNLTGYFDVLIQMDLAQKQCNERRKDVATLRRPTTNATKTN